MTQNDEFNDEGDVDPERPVEFKVYFTFVLVVFNFSYYYSALKIWFGVWSGSQVCQLVEAAQLIICTLVILLTAIRKE